MPTLQTCSRDILAGVEPQGDAPPPVYPYTHQSCFRTRIAGDALPAMSINHMLGPLPSGQAYDYVVNALYASHDKGMLLYL